jgi:hypothetical protein
VWSQRSIGALPCPAPPRPASRGPRTANPRSKKEEGFEALGAYLLGHASARTPTSLNEIDLATQVGRETNAASRLRAPQNFQCPEPGERRPPVTDRRVSPPPIPAGRVRRTNSPTPRTVCMPVAGRGTGENEITTPAASTSCSIGAVWCSGVLSAADAEAAECVLLSLSLSAAALTLSATTASQHGRALGQR